MNFLKRLLLSTLLLVGPAAGGPVTVGDSRYAEIGLSSCSEQGEVLLNGTVATHICVTPGPIATAKWVSYLAATTFAGVDACLESFNTRDCYAYGEIQLPAGHNITSWATANFSARGPTIGNLLDGADRKSLNCIGAVFSGTDNGVADTATWTWDYSRIEHDAEVYSHGCSFNGPPNSGFTDVEPTLRLESVPGTGQAFRWYMDDCHFGQYSPSIGGAITTTSTIQIATFSLQNCQFDAGLGQSAAFVTLLGTHGSSSGQAGRFFFKDIVVTSTSTGAPQFLNADLATSAVPSNIFLNNVLLVGGGITGNAQFVFGPNFPTNVDMRGLKIFSNNGTQRTASVFSYSNTASVAPRSIIGDVTIRSASSVTSFGALYEVLGAGRGPTIVDATVHFSGAIGLFPALAFAETGATLDLKQVNLRADGFLNVPSGSDTPSFFNRTYFDKLISEGTANGTLTLNGKSLSVVNGMIGTRSLDQGFLFSRTFNVLAVSTDTPLFTVPATPTPMVITKAACFSEDTTGSALFSLYKNTFAGTPLTAANLACGYRVAALTATTCSGGAPCVGTTPQSGTGFVIPDDKSIICSSTTPATSFQINASGDCRNRVNIDSCLKAIDATSLTWTPTVSVTANMVCSYDTKPVWHPMTQNNTFSTAADVLGLHTGTGWLGIGKTRIMIESTPAF